MSFDYIGLEQAITADGIRMVVPQGIPSPWSEAAKGFLHLRQLPWQAVYLDQRNEAMKLWTGKRSAPVLMCDDNAPIHQWQDILTFANQHGQGIDLLPEGKAQQQQILALCESLIGQNGLAWNRRLVCVDKGLKGEAGGYPDFIANYLAKKYGYNAADAAGYLPRVVETLKELSKRIQQQQAAGSSFLFGQQLSAADVYCACVMAFFKPYGEEQCAMSPVIRTVFESLSEAEQEALDPCLFQHRDFIYQQYLELPLKL